MPEPRIFIQPSALHGTALHLQSDAFEHLAVVLRRGLGDRFIAVDALSGVEYVAQISSLGRRGLEAVVVESRQARERPSIELFLYQGLPKGKRFPLIIQKCTELGVARIVPVLTERTVVRVEPDGVGEKAPRWARIAREAARQSMRPLPPIVEAPLELPEALSDWKASGGMGLLLDEALAGRGDSALRAALSGITDARRLSVFVGPEGGFSAHEAQLARDTGLAPVGLGSRILRTETAAIAICAVVMYEAGELG